MDTNGNVCNSNGVIVAIAPNQIIDIAEVADDIAAPNNVSPISILRRDNFVG